MRYLVANKIVEIAQAFGSELTEQQLLPAYISFLQDTESEVRTAAVSKLKEFCNVIDAKEVER